MKVRELINALSNCDPDAEVVTKAWPDQTNPVTRVTKGVVMDGDYYSNSTALEVYAPDEVEWARKRATAVCLWFKR